MPTVYTIGHSTRPIDEFCSMLHSFGVEVLADIRRFPVSKRYPQFNKLSLEKSLLEVTIKYIHYPELGGRREPLTYSEYILTDDFNNGITALEELAHSLVLAYMCSEGDWKRCHRSLVSDHLKVKGWDVIHILGISSSEEHVVRSEQQKLF